MDWRFLALLPILLAAGPANPDPAKELAGRYYRQFPNALVGGEKYTGEDIVEIVPVASRAAYVRLHLDYYNGHICTLSGIAEAKDGALVFDDRGRFGERCHLRIEQSGKWLLLNDGGGTCQSYCGARGTLSDVRLRYASKRQIRYLARLKKSAQYQEALADWRKQKE